MSVSQKMHLLAKWKHDFTDIELDMTMSHFAYDDFLDYLIEKVTPAEILAFQPSAKALARAEILLDRSSEGVLTLDERTELEQMLRADRLASVLKARAAAIMR